jgi:hypothetical protein
LVFGEWPLAQGACRQLLLAEQPGFKGQKRRLEEEVVNGGHTAFFLPKFLRRTALFAMWVQGRRWIERKMPR